ncbi:tetratricopeptide repeat protein 36 [Galendromus occidentalis]|uniref:Tetratricopeptide repeat protein 36 n=1 Tax=Galendromus occidentalis TaxID=34638 RepID=A0AAJ6VZB2_9ACAR|nr:tetratricopeptide repeat protein 36 [Galendromus occidentalis]
MATANDRAVLEVLFNPLFAEIPPETDDLDDDVKDWTPSNLEVKAVALAETGRYRESLEMLTSLLARNDVSHLDRASLLNDSAQVKRLLGDTTGARQDIESVLELRVNRRAQRQALVQKAILERLDGRPENGLALMRQAAALGSRFARTQLAVHKENPYAALCNQMLNRMFAELRGECQ